MLVKILSHLITPSFCLSALFALTIGVISSAEAGKSAITQNTLEAIKTYQKTCEAYSNKNIEKNYKFKKNAKVKIKNGKIVNVYTRVRRLREKHSKGLLSNEDKQKLTDLNVSLSDNKFIPFCSTKLSTIINLQGNPHTPLECTKEETEAFRKKEDQREGLLKIHCRPVLKASPHISYPPKPVFPEE